MSTSALVAIVLVAVAVIGSFGVRMSRSASDFLVASPTTRPVANASVISREYLSRRISREQVSVDVDVAMLRLHAPERLGFGQDRVNRSVG